MGLQYYEPLGTTPSSLRSVETSLGEGPRRPSAHQGKAQPGSLGLPAPWSLGFLGPPGRALGRRSQGSQGEVEPRILGARGAPRAHQALRGAPGLGHTQGQAPNGPPGSQERMSKRPPGASQKEAERRTRLGARQGEAEPGLLGAPGAPWPPGAAKPLAKQTENLLENYAIFHDWSLK